MRVCRLLALLQCYRDGTPTKTLPRLKTLLRGEEEGGEGAEREEWREEKRLGGGGGVGRGVVGRVETFFCGGGGGEKLLPEAVTHV